jgi:hypothetical protein
MIFLTVFNNQSRTRISLLIDEIIKTLSNPRFLKFLIPQPDLEPSLHGGAKLKPKVLP